MTRIERLSDAVTLYLGDCREILPTLGKVDAVVTDPPYGIGRDGKPKSTSRSGGHKGYEAKGWDKKRPSKATFDLILKAGPKIAIWGGNYFADLLPPTSKWLSWDKMQRIDQSDAELCWTSLEGAMRVCSISRAEIGRDGAVHPTQKPVRLMAWTIDQLEVKGGGILDPFMGSGSTGVACLRAGFGFIGIEQDRDYFDIACRRISDELKRPRLDLAAPAPAAVQEALKL